MAEFMGMNEGEGDEDDDSQKIRGLKRVKTIKESPI
jgi:hypothetical protein